MNTTKIQLVAIDLDGTLLNSAKQLTDSTAATLRAVRRVTGGHVVLASARPPRGSMGFYTSLRLDTPMINYNGALVHRPTDGKVLLHRPLPAATAAEAVRLARGVYSDVLVSAEIMDKWYTDRVDDRYPTDTARNFRPDLVAPVSQWLRQSVTKLLLLGEPDKLAAVAQTISAHLAEHVQLAQARDFLLQVMHPTVSKAYALRMVAGELGVSREQVMAIGDNVNDIDMLRWAKIGVAMGNAPGEVQAAADYITAANDAEGVARAVQAFVLHANG